MLTVVCCLQKMKRVAFIAFLERHLKELCHVMFYEQNLSVLFNDITQLQILRKLYEC